MIAEEIRAKLFGMQDEAYKAFNSKLIPNVNPDTMIGIRTPELRKYAKQLAKEPNVKEFLNALPHTYFEENQLHAFVISGMKEFEACLEEVNRFLPFVDNWATCDQLSPKIFKKNREALAEYIRIWIASDQTYTVRFAIGMLMEHFLDEDFNLAYPKMVSAVRSREYYINMMTAWYFATALAKQYDAVLPFMEKQTLDDWTHNKTIQKSVESYRILPEQKEYLRSLKVKKKQIGRNSDENTAH